MRILILVACFCFCLCTKGRCDSTVSGLENNYTQMRDVNITYEALISFELSPYFIRTFPSQVFEAKWQTKVFFCANELGFDLEVTRLGAHPKFDRFAYDGSAYASYHGSLKDLTISKTAAVSAEFWNANSLLLFPGMFKPNASKCINLLWSDATSPAWWTGLSSALLPDSKGHFSGELSGCKMTITLDKANPIGIAGSENYPEHSEGRLANEYICAEIGEAHFEVNGKEQTFFYPKKEVLQRFEETGELLRTETHEIKMIGINDPQFSESKFKMEPTIAQHIFNTDSKVWIR